ncbi:MAG: MauE/DoxX family redox-associated membrane protein [Dehalococcoidia bacterium]
MLVRTLLAALLIAMALGQASDFAGFVEIVETYRVGWGSIEPLFAGAVLGLELASGLVLIGGRRLIDGRLLLAAAAAALIVTVGWSLLAVQAFVRGLDIANCGCFGVHFGQSLRWWVLLEDAEFILMAGWTLRGVRRAAAGRERSGGGRRAGVGRRAWV